MDFDMALQEFADLLSIGSSALQAMLQQNVEQVGLDSLAGQLEEIQGIAQRLSEIAKTIKPS